ncbi:MAG TPA: serine/threonine-protein kinase [Candidatus Dormibacteraeota bacterium]|nr:serine/threonine-protein kinase [Candidatus Dormibacteraeota bacterium]
MNRLGRFNLDTELGQGAMGIVYRAIHPGLKVQIAVKVLAEQYSSDPAFRRRFQGEAAAIAALNHPAIVRVYDFDEDQGSLFIVMEYVEGRSLRNWLQNGGRFTVPASLDIIKQVLSGVGAAHSRGVIHRDLKPENLLLTEEGRIKVLDFGIAAMLDETSIFTHAKSIAGTPSYMSPEQSQGLPVDRRADIYSIGIILYELLHGRPPFVGSVQAVLRSQMYEKPPASEAIPRSLMDVIWKATAKAPSERYATCEEFTSALAARAGLGSLPEPESTSRVGFDRPILQPMLVEAIPVLTPEPDLPGHCGRTGCTVAEGWQCSYVDKSRDACETWWCKDHVKFVQGEPYCLRHASVLEAVLPTLGTIHEIKVLPDVDDRSLALAALVSSAIDRETIGLLKNYFDKASSIMSDNRVRQSWAGRHPVAWEQTWSVLENRTYAFRLTLRVTAAKPALVQITDGQTVLELVPDWIINRLEGQPPDERDRDRFKARMLEAIEEIVRTAQAKGKGSGPKGRR